MSYFRSPMSTPLHNSSELLLYETEDGVLRVQVKMVDETVWLSQEEMSTLFDRSISTMSEHISHIFTEGELSEKETVRSFGNSEIVSGKPTKYYNLDVIISVGYRVKSLLGTKFLSEGYRYLCDEYRLQDGNWTKHQLPRNTR